MITAALVRNMWESVVHHLYARAVAQLHGKVAKYSLHLLQQQGHLPAYHSRME